MLVQRNRRDKGGVPIRSYSDSVKIDVRRSFSKIVFSAWNGSGTVSTLLCAPPRRFSGARPHGPYETGWERCACC
jgi:hypothetical protein